MSYLDEEVTAMVDKHSVNDDHLTTTREARLGIQCIASWYYTKKYKTHSSLLTFILVWEGIEVIVANDALRALPINNASSGQEKASVRRSRSSTNRNKI